MNPSLLLVKKYQDYFAFPTVPIKFLLPPPKVFSKKCEIDEKAV